MTSFSLFTVKLHDKYPLKLISQRVCTYATHSSINGYLYLAPDHFKTYLSCFHPLPVPPPPKKNKQTEEEAKKYKRLPLTKKQRHHSEVQISSVSNRLSPVGGRKWIASPAIYMSILVSR